MTNSKTSPCLQTSTCLQISPCRKTSIWRDVGRTLRGRFFHLLHLCRRPMTLGVRAIVLDDQNRVFLVRHGYLPGWHFPGGGVEVGETVVEALAKELAEEANIALTGPARLHGVFLNRVYTRRDHVVVYVVRDFVVNGPRPPDWEIAETGFFALDALPPDISSATRRRLDELSGAPLSPYW